MRAIMLRPDNPMTKVLLSVLIFEVICCGLAVPVMINVEHLDLVVSSVAGGGVALAALVATLTMRMPQVGYPIGWLTQVAAVLLGLMTPGMWIIGGLFGGLWVISFVLGKRLEQMQPQT